MKWFERVGRRIKLRDLHVLLAVVQSGSLAKAAEDLAISTPVVSKVIADLERTLGVKLLDRDRHGATPTIFGAALLKSGVAVFDDLKHGIQEIEFLSDPAGGELRVGASVTMVEGLLPVVIDRLFRRYPRLRIEVTADHSGSALWRALRERNVDIALFRIPTLDDDLDAEVLFDDPHFGSRALGAVGRIAATYNCANSSTSLGFFRSQTASPALSLPQRLLQADWRFRGRGSSAACSR